MPARPRGRGKFNNSQARGNVSYEGSGAISQIGRSVSPDSIQQMKLRELDIRSIHCLEKVMITFGSWRPAVLRFDTGSGYGNDRSI